MLSQFLKFFSGLCQIGPPPLSTFPETNNLNINTTINESIKRRDELKIRCDELSHDIELLENEFRKLAPTYERMENGKIYRDPIVLSRLAVIEKQQIDLQEEYNSKTTFLNNINEGIKAYYVTQDAILMDSILKNNTRLINDSLKESGGVAAMKDTVEEASAVLYKTQTLSDIISTPLKPIASSSTSIDIDVPVEDKEVFQQSLLQKIKTISSSPSPSSSSLPLSSSRVTSKKQFNVSFQALPQVPASSIPTNPPQIPLSLQKKERPARVLQAVGQ